MTPEMTTEDIRSIRESLGLSQVQAGNLLGGGPRAFSKYESGAIKPAASIVNLLHLLEADPTAIKTLGGTLPKPIGDISAGPFEVTGKNIEALNERQFPDLLRRLLIAEDKTNNLLSADKIHVASDIHIKDGGEDGRIEWKDGPERTRNLPSRRCQFQLKAGKIQGQAGKEVMASDKKNVKPMVREFLSSGGHYILLCAKPYTKQQILKHENSIRTELRKVGTTIDDEQVSFRDADQIATWVNCHSPVATWVKEQTQPGSLGPFHSWTHWAGRREYHWSPWIEDERLVPFWVEDERLAPLQRWLYPLVSTLQCSVRIVGLTGIGKSRLVLQALGPADADLAAIAMYAVESESSPSSIKQTVQRLADSATRAIVVVDECSLDTHRSLAGMVSHAKSHLSLITIDNEIPPDLSNESTWCIPKASPDVSRAIIKREPSLAPDDQSRLVQLASGFPGICRPIIKAWTTGSPISHATDDDLVNAFVLGRHPGPGDSTSLLETATLISVAGVVEFDPGTSRLIVMNSYGWPQLDDLVKLTKDLTKEELYADVQDLLDRGVLKKRGRLVTLEPRPIAMRLAERKWERWTKDKWDQILGGNTHPSLKIYAARQLTLLNTTDSARNIVEYVCRDDGPFAEIQGIMKEGHPEVMSAFSEVDVTVVVNLLERFDLQKIGGNLRRQFVITIEKISFCPDTFELGADLLLRLAVAENEAWGNNATEQFKALFPIILGNTAADGDSRLKMLDSASETNDVAQRILVVEALAQGAQTNDFFRIGNAGAHGTRPSLESWQPNTKDEAKRYIEGCVERLAKFAVRDDEPAAIAREFLGLYLRSLILNGFIDVVEKVCQKLVDQVEYWPEGLESLGMIIRLDTKKLNPPQLVDRVKKLIASLKPKNIETRLRMLVTEMSWDYPDDEELEPETKRQRQTEAVRQLADELVKRPKDLAKYIPELSRKPVKDTRMRQRMTGYFGYAIAELAESPSEWYEPIVQALLAAPQAERDYGLLTGYVTVLAKADPDVEQRLKQEIATTPSLAPAFPEICLWLEIKPSDVAIAVNALKSDLIKPVDLHKWNMGGQLAKLPVHDVAPLLDALLDRDAQSCHVALDLMDMYFYPGKDRLEGLHPQIQLALKSITKWRLHGKSIEAYLEFHKMLVCLLKKGRNDDDAKTIALELSKALVNSDLFSNWYDPNSALRNVISVLLSEFPEIAWTIVGEAILSDPIKARKLKFILGNELSASYRQKPVILSLPKETLFAWCYANPEKAPIFAAEVLPFLTSYDREKLDSDLHPVMGQLIDQFGHLDKFKYLKNFWTAIYQNIFNFSGWGSPTTYYKLYQRPLDALQKHEKPEVRTWSRKLLKELKSHIEAARDDKEDLENLVSPI